MSNRRIRIPSKTALLLAISLGFISSAGHAVTYKIDPAHSFIEFSISHLGFSVLKGRFNRLHGQFVHDEGNPGESSIHVEVDTASIDSNHAERDKHLRGEDFLDVKRFPTADFKSTGFQQQGNSGKLSGELTLHGVTRPVSMEVEFIGAGPDPWGGFRRGYKGKLNIKRADFNLHYNLGPASEDMELAVFIEGVQVR